MVLVAHLDYLPVLPVASSLKLGTEHLAFCALTIAAFFPLVEESTWRLLRDLRLWSQGLEHNCPICSMLYVSMYSHNDGPSGRLQYV